MIDFIQGDRFEKVADLTFAPPEMSGADYSKLSNTFSVEGCLKFNPCIVYTHTFYAKELFNIIKDINNRFIIVTHNSDDDICFSPPDNVIKWFSQNVNIIHEKIQSIPIGLENDRWFVDIYKKEKMIVKLQEPKDYRNLVYMNFNISTAPNKRQPVYDLFKDKPWVTVDMRQNGVDFDNYLDNIYNHKFVLCPGGNGIDTHRIWECLYMGTIPIVDNNINNSFYDKLPLLTINNWDSITEDKLLLSYIPLYMQDQHKEILTFEYWKNKIWNTTL